MTASPLVEGASSTFEPSQIQNVMFLVTENCLIFKGLYQFKQDYYGPRDKQIYQDLRELSRQALVSLTVKKGSSYDVYAVTAGGFALGAAKFNTLPVKERAYLARASKWVIDQSFSQLHASMVAHYPAWCKR